MLDSSPLTPEARAAVAPWRPGARITVVGSFVELDLPADLSRLFVDGRLVDPRNGTPMEMDGYSAYLALKAIERATGTTLTPEKSRLLDAVLRRLDGSIPDFGHGAWTGSNDEIHMRFTAAAVRLLSEALRDGLLADTTALLRAFRYHLSFREPIGFGTWFLHDSLEKGAVREANVGKRTRNRAWGSSIENNLVLNTHLDTLTTALDVLPLLSPIETAKLEPIVESGLAALKGVLGAPGRVWARLSRIDHVARDLMFRAYGSKGLAARLLRSVLVRIYYPARARFRAAWPVFAMGDGYLERDISLRGRALEYHMVNVYDLARFAQKMRSSKFASHARLIGMCEALADRGLDYAVRSSYWHYVTWSMASSSRAIILCEAILLRLAYRRDQQIPRHWLDAYCEIRRRLAPSPAILGYDPFVVRSPPDGGPVRFGSGEDHLHLLDGRRLTIDIRRAEYAWA